MLRDVMEASGGLFAPQQEQQGPCQKPPGDVTGHES
jgi:hypothetical protein